ncbi:MAG: BstXI family restriction endonuclease [Saprospiraceae bacterium]
MSNKKQKIPKLPKLLNSKIYKTGQTRGATDDEIYQNRVNRNSTVIIPYSVFDLCKVAPNNNGKFENGFIVIIKPEDYFDNKEFIKEMGGRGIFLGQNSLLFYETREQWNKYNPNLKQLNFANSRTNPLGGVYVARVPSTTSLSDEKILHGYTTSGLKGAGIRVYEYASKKIISDCQFQLEYLFWLCEDSIEILLNEGLSSDEIKIRKEWIELSVNQEGLDTKEKLIEARIIDNENFTICPLCLERLSAGGFLNKLEQAEGRDVPDLTVTQLNLFHIRELRTGEFNHKPYNLGWGHHHCNVVTKDSGIHETIEWMEKIVDKNKEMKLTKK